MHFNIAVFKLSFDENRLLSLFVGFAGVLHVVVCFSFFLPFLLGFDLDDDVVDYGEGAVEDAGEDEYEEGPGHDDLAGVEFDSGSADSVLHGDLAVVSDKPGRAGAEDGQVVSNVCAFASVLARVVCDTDVVLDLAVASGEPNGAFARVVGVCVGAGAYSAV